MAITPQQIADKKFSRAMRGYNEDEVDAFLDEIIEELENWEKEKEDNARTVSTVGKQLENYKAMEETLRETLVVAQRSAEDILSRARERASSILSEAQRQADQIIGESKRNERELRASYDRNMTDMNKARAQMRNMLENQLRLLDQGESIVVPASVEIKEEAPAQIEADAVPVEVTE